MEEKETQSFDILQMGMLSGSEFSDQQLEQILNMGKIRPTEKPDMPPQILWVDDCTLATFGNFSASTGKAKSKKTISISCMVAAALKNGTVLKYRACLPKGKDKILYFDTEQSRYHCHNVLSRILRLAGLPTDRDCDRITFVGLREFTPALRISLIDYALRKSRGYGLVIIDGLRDLMYDINNAKEATDVMTKLMSWTSKYNLHIHCVLHLNKNDNNTRGHIGTELENKAETVLVVSKDKKNASISEVRPMHMRDREFASFAFSIGDDAMPVLQLIASGCPAARSFAGRPACPRRKEEPEWKDVRVYELSSRPLMSYISRRGIAQHIALRHCKEVSYELLYPTL